jgi:hypothetical protein
MIDELTRVSQGIVEPVFGRIKFNRKIDASNEAADRQRARSDGD